MDLQSIAMITPCVGKCELDTSTSICKGCGRTHEEIQNWSGFAEEQQMEIMRRLGYGRRKTREERLRRYDRG